MTVEAVLRLPIRRRLRIGNLLKLADELHRHLGHTVRL